MILPECYRVMGTNPDTGIHECYGATRDLYTAEVSAEEAKATEWENVEIIHKPASYCPT